MKRVAQDLKELPPRARRIPRIRRRGSTTRGTTSACAENTILHAPFDWAIGNYLRVRGEYPKFHRWGGAQWELPPRARRILRNLRLPINDDGTTSACAENTFHRKMQIPWSGNYLRVRGEYFGCGQAPSAFLELPPRARRIRWSERQKGHHHGTTSACAENTWCRCWCERIRWNYLRVRGEYRAKRPVKPSGPELPPRARRIPDRQNFGWQTMGTTSACAENTR